MINQRLPESVEERLSLTFFIVEANDFEHLALWSNHSDNSRERSLFRSSHVWEDISDGRMVQLGKLNNRPVLISLKWAWIDGRLVMFYYGCSQLVDHAMINEWIDTNFTKTYNKGIQRAQTDATNFGHCLSAIKEANSK